MKCKLANICDFVKQKIDVASLDISNYISTENMMPNKAGIADAATLPNVVQTQSFEKGDTLVSNIRPYFKKIWYASFEGGCSNDVLVFRAKTNVKPRFLYYVLADDTFFEYATSTAKGTKMPRGDKKAILEYEVPDISYKEQEKIANVLSALDDTIALNQQINKNLEEQLNIVYHQIFDKEKDFLELGAAIKTTSGGTPARKQEEFYRDAHICWVKSKELAGGYIFDTEEKINDIAIKKSSAKILPTHSVLIAMYGATVGEFAIIAKPMACNQAICALLDSDTYPYTYLYQFIKEEKAHLLNMAVGSAQQNISQILIKQLPIHANTEKVKEFHSLVKPIHEQKEALGKECTVLSDLRDALLPRLMSGEIDVSKIEI